MKNYMNEGSSKLLRSVVLGIVFGLISMTILTLIFSFVVASANPSNSTVKILSSIIIGVSALLCGISAAKFNKEKILLVGIASGAALYFFIGVIAMVITKNAFSGTFLIRMMIAVASSAVGSVLSMLTGNRNKYI